MPGVEFKMYCLPEQAPVQTHVRVETGWSVTTDAPCWVVRAENVRGVVSSEIVAQGYPTDCTPLPEHPAAAGMACGLIALAVFARGRRSVEVH